MWGPAQRRAAVAVTFDNLGEASELERGRWPPDEPLGRHGSVTRALPRVLTLLSEHGLPATFFVEGVNARLYPDALRTIVAAGHELAYHGWRHETWADLTPAHERELLERGVDALGQVVPRPVGFRPPGGALLPSAWRALAQTGFTYCSPAGEGAARRCGLSVLPFRWTLVDAFHYLPHFAQRRRVALGNPEGLPPAALQANLSKALRQAAMQGSFLALVFHPFLADDGDRLKAADAALAELRELVDQQSVWCASMREIAAWVSDQPGAGSWTLRLDQE